MIAQIYSILQKADMREFFSLEFFFLRQMSHKLNCVSFIQLLCQPPIYTWYPLNESPHSIIFFLFPHKFSKLWKLITYSLITSSSALLISFVSKKKKTTIKSKLNAVNVDTPSLCLKRLIFINLQYFKKWIVNNDLKKKKKSTLLCATRFNMDCVMHHKASFSKLPVNSNRLVENYRLYFILFNNSLILVMYNMIRCQKWGLGRCLAPVQWSTTWIKIMDNQSTLNPGCCQIFLEEPKLQVLPVCLWRAKSSDSVQYM